MMQMMQIALLASPPLKNHLQHNLKKPSLDAPSSPSMCRVYVYLLRATPPPDPLTTHFVRQTQLRWRLLRRLAFVTVSGHADTPYPDVLFFSSSQNLFGPLFLMFFQPISVLLPCSPLGMLPSCRPVVLLALSVTASLLVCDVFVLFSFPHPFVLSCPFLVLHIAFRGRGCSCPPQQQFLLTKLFGVYAGRMFEKWNGFIDSNVTKLHL